MASATGQAPSTGSGQGPEGKSSKRTLWIVLGVLIFCCVCAGGGAALWWLWNNGDQLLKGISGLLSSALV
ncbi:MAG: hypothetical protein ACRDHY_08785 [Anaerolineales bacterium]